MIPCYLLSCSAWSAASLFILFFTWYSLGCWFDFLEGLLYHWCSQIKAVVHIWNTDQMPSLKMKTKLSTSCFKEKNGLHVCQKSSQISKNSCSYVRISEQTAEFDSFIHKCQDGKPLQIMLNLLENLLCTLCLH